MRHNAGSIYTTLRKGRLSKSEVYNNKHLTNSELASGQFYTDGWWRAKPQPAGEFTSYSSWKRLVQPLIDTTWPGFENPRVPASEGTQQGSQCGQSQTPPQRLSYLLPLLTSACCFTPPQINPFSWTFLDFASKLFRDCKPSHWGSADAQTTGVSAAGQRLWAGLGDSRTHRHREDRAEIPPS